MKKLHQNQIAAGIKRALAYRNKMLCYFAITLFLSFALPSICMAVSNPSDKSAEVAATSTITLAGAAGIVNLEEVSDRDTAGNQIGNQIYYVRTDQIDKTKPWPKANSLRELGTIPIKSGEYFHYFHSHNDPDESSKGEKAELTTNVTSTFNSVLGSNSADVLNFLENNAGRKFILFWFDNTIGKWMTGGTVFKPYTLKSFDRSNNKDGKFSKIVFECNNFSQPCIYTGTILQQEPSTQNVGATVLTVAPGQDAYYVPNGTSSAAAITSIAGITATDVGRVITLYGQGTDKSATIADSAVFILKDSATWTAKSGSQLVLKIYDTQTLVEVEGSRIQMP